MDIVSECSNVLQLVIIHHGLQVTPQEINQLVSCLENAAIPQVPFYRSTIQMKTEVNTGAPYS
jgi:uncharacterized tellurite resistance protein B-like protein